MALSHEEGSSIHLRLKLKSNLRYQRLTLFLLCLSLSSARHSSWDGKSFDTLEGADPSSLGNRVAKVAGTINSGETTSPACPGLVAAHVILETVEELTKETDFVKQKIQAQLGPSDSLKMQLKQLIDSNPIMLFMKGNPEELKCWFSQKVVDILKEEKVKFGSLEILSDNEVHEGLKKLSNWPTYPHLYCNGELLGGCDIVIAMHESGELQEVFKEHGINANDSAKIPETGNGKGGIAVFTDLSTTLASWLKSLINSDSAMLFMKGKPDDPKCFFSRKIVENALERKCAFLRVLIFSRIKKSVKGSKFI